MWSGLGSRRVMIRFEDEHRSVRLEDLFSSCIIRVSSCVVTPRRQPAAGLPAHHARVYVHSDPMIYHHLVIAPHHHTPIVRRHFPSLSLCASPTQTTSRRLSILRTSHRLNSSTINSLIIHSNIRACRPAPRRVAYIPLVCAIATARAFFCCQRAG